METDILALVIKQKAVHDSTPNGYCFRQGIRHALPSPGGVNDDASRAVSAERILSLPRLNWSPIPFMLAYYLQDLQIQPPGTEAPLSLMAIGALEVCAASFTLRRDVPASTSFVGDKRELVVIGNLLDEERVMMDGG